jgi:multiple sugar transport system substrate-binding protein
MSRLSKGYDAFGSILPQRRIQVLLSFLLVAAMFLFTGCDLFSPTRQVSPEQNPTQAAPTEVQLPTETPLVLTPTPSGPFTLTLWIPPEFDPKSGSQAGVIFKERLDEFTAQNPEIKLDVRVKNVKGPGGLLDSLSTATAAAPSALPDLVILPSEHVEGMARKGLISPFNNLTSAMENSDWYGFARSMTQVQDKNYGLPIATDALVQVYQRDKESQHSQDWTGVLDKKNRIVFPAANPDAWFPLALYLGNKGTVLDEQGQTNLEIDHLVDVLTFFQQARDTDVMQEWLTDIQLDEQAWQAYQQDQARLLVTWISSYLKQPNGTQGVALLPSPNGSPLTMGNGWVWALTSPNIAHQSDSVKLAEFMSESNFLARWSEALGVIPTRPSSLNKWARKGLVAQIEPIAQALQPFPPYDVVATLGPLLQKATIDVLTAESDPLNAAQTAEQGLK